MSLNLTKGQKVDLTKGNDGLNEIKIGLGWDVNGYSGGENFDLDAVLIPTNKDGKVNDSSDVVYYGNLKTKGILHFGDNLTGAGDGDDEVITVKLSDVDSGVENIDIHVVIYEAASRNQNFGMVNGTFVRVEDVATSTELLRYDMGEDYSISTMLYVGSVYRHNGEWKFKAVGNGSQGGLKDILTTVGL